MSSKNTYTDTIWCEKRFLFSTQIVISQRNVSQYKWVDLDKEQKDKMKLKKREKRKTKS